MAGVHRRTPVLVILALAALSACSPADPPAPTAAPPASAPAPAPAGSVASSSAAPASVAPAPAKDGAPDRRFPIGTRRLSFDRGPDRPLPTTVWYPTSGDGPFPLVLFSHGLTSEPGAYASVLREWARAGFVVAAPAYPHTSHGVRDFDPVDVINQPSDAGEVITRMLALNDKAGDPLEGRIDTARVAAAGHSAGGITTIGMFSGNRDDRLTAGIVLSGRQVLPVPFSGAPAPILFVHGKLDKTVKYAEGLAAFEAVPWPKAMMAVTRGGHVAITKDFDPVIATTTDFLRYGLYGDAEARKRLERDATRGGRATLTDEL
jgi:dienelactone hydrolase